MADSNRVLLTTAKESTFGTAPGGTYKSLPFTSHSLRGTSDRQADTTIRSDAQMLEPQQLSIGAEGDVNSMIKYGTNDDWLAASLRHSTTWDAGATIATANVNIAINATTGVITLGTGTWSVTPTAYKWIRITNATNAGNNNVFKVASATTTTITVSNKVGMVTESAAAAITIKQGEQITNGVGLDSWTIEATHEDLTTVLYPRWVGMVINRLRLGMTVRSFGNMTFGFVGKKEIGPIPTTTDAGGVTPYTDFASMQCVDNVLKMQYLNAAVELTDFNIEINNSISGHEVLGSLGPVRARAGSFGVTGNVKAYFQDATLANDFLSNAVGSLSLVMKDSSNALGNIYIIDLPAMKFGGAPRDVSGINTDVMLDLPILGFRQSTENSTLRIVRFPNA